MANSYSAATFVIEVRRAGSAAISGAAALAAGAGKMSSAQDAAGDATKQEQTMMISSPLRGGNFACTVSIDLPQEGRFVVTATPSLGPDGRGLGLWSPKKHTVIVS